MRMSDLQQKDIISTKDGKRIGRIIDIVVNENGTIELIRRLNFSKLSDFIYACKDYLPKYFKKINIKELNLTKNYLYNKTIENTKTEYSEKDFTVTEIDIPVETIEESKFSKSLPNIITNAEKQNMEFGTLVHEILEFIDFKNFDENLIENGFIKSKIKKFLSNKITQPPLFNKFATNMLTIYLLIVYNYDRIFLTLNSIIIYGIRLF